MTHQSICEKIALEKKNPINIRTAKTLNNRFQAPSVEKGILFINAVKRLCFFELSDPAFTAQGDIDPC